MEITLVDLALFALAFVFLFVLPGYAFLREKKPAEVFIISCGVVFFESLLLSLVGWLNWLALLVAVGATIILFYRFASPLSASLRHGLGRVRLLS